MTRIDPATVTERRERVGISGVHLAAEIGVARSTLSRAEAGGIGSQRVILRAATYLDHIEAAQAAARIALALLA